MNSVYYFSIIIAIFFAFFHLLRWRKRKKQKKASEVLYGPHLKFGSFSELDEYDMFYENWKNQSSKITKKYNTEAVMKGIFHLEDKLTAEQESLNLYNNFSVEVSSFQTYDSIPDKIIEASGYRVNMAFVYYKNQMIAQMSPIFSDESKINFSHYKILVYDNTTFYNAVFRFSEVKPWGYKEDVNSLQEFVDVLNIARKSALTAHIRYLS